MVKITAIVHRLKPNRSAGFDLNCSFKRVGGKIKLERKLALCSFQGRNLLGVCMEGKTSPPSD